MESRKRQKHDLQPLISVIIPVYQVEKYLDRCVTSVINQTYANLEIILVDDGSFDSCPQLCDGWTSRDKRIKVIHKENGGLSEARNVGTKASTGEYIGFVDSDDYINPDMYLMLMDAVRKTDADIGMCGVVTENEDECISTETVKGTCEYVVLSGEDAIIDLFTCNTYVRHAAWNKLYKRALFDDIQFPEKRLFEDAAIMYKILSMTDKVVFIDALLYHYVQRQGSICHSAYTKESVLHRLYNGVDAYKYFDYEKRFQDAAFIWISKSIIKLWGDAYCNGDMDTAEIVYGKFNEIYDSKMLGLLSWKKRLKIYIFVNKPVWLYYLRKMRGICGSKRKI